MTPDNDKQQKAHPNVVRLYQCPHCGYYGIPAGNSTHGCLKCAQPVTDADRLDALERRIEELEQVSVYINRPIGGSR